MPQDCCVPGCTIKVYEEDGVKISFHKFPEDRELFRKWIVAIQRDIGKEFRVTDHTRVCSRHFKSCHYLTSLAGNDADKECLMKTCKACITGNLLGSLL